MLLSTFLRSAHPLRLSFNCHQPFNSPWRKLSTEPFNPQTPSRMNYSFPNGKIRAQVQATKKKPLLMYTTSPFNSPWRKLSTEPLNPKTPPRMNHPFPNSKTKAQVQATKNRALLMYTTSVIIIAVGASYAAVPLYRMFCAATGFAGTPKVGTGRFEPNRLVPVENAVRIKVHFNADRSEQLPWTFKPQQKYVNVLPGETSLAFYTAKNNSNKDIIGIATYNVTPDRVAPYFSKVECFCFEEQRLLAGEEVDMPLLFFIDRDILEDPACKNVEDVVLSYTFFRARRNQQGQLEPDATEDVVQNSLGFGGYERAPKPEHRKEGDSSSSETISTSQPT